MLGEISVVSPPPTEIRVRSACTPSQRVEGESLAWHIHAHTLPRQDCKHHSQVSVEPRPSERDRGEEMLTPPPPPMPHVGSRTGGSDVRCVCTAACIPILLHVPFMIMTPPR
jgi:hypothetical protein